jgi:hypothetical protein
LVAQQTHLLAAQSLDSLVVVIVVMVRDDDLRKTSMYLPESGS